MKIVRRKLRKNLRLCTLDGITATPICFLLQPGNFIAAALLAGLYQLPPSVYGLIVSLPFWCNFLQAGLTPLLTRFANARTVAVAAGAAQALFVTLLSATMFMLPPAHPEVSGPWLVAFFGLLGMTSAFAAVGWTSWIQEWVPRRLRGRYFGLRNRILQLVTVVFLLASGWILDRLGRSVLAFQIVLIGTVLLRIGSVWFQQRTHTVSLQRPAKPLPWLAQLEVLRTHSAYFWFVSFGAIWGFAANFFGAFYPVFMYQHLGLSIKGVSFMLILTGIGSAVSYPGWGRLADRFGNKPVMIVCLIAWQLQYAAWIFLTPENAWLLYGLWTFGGLVSAGFVLGLFNIQLKLIPPAAKTLAISINLAVTSLVTAIAPIAGGAMLQYLQGTGMDPLTVYHRLFIAQPMIALCACGLLFRLPEPDASPLGTVVGAMRNVRTLSGIFGVTYLTNFVFVKTPRTWSRPSTRLPETSSGNAR